MNTRPLFILSRAFFFLGVGLGFGLSVIAIWNNIESTSYFFRGSTFAPFHGLRCPVMIAPTENGIVTSIFRNPNDEEDVFYYRVQISGRSSAMRTLEDKLTVPAHQTRSVQWAVDTRDVDLRFFILVKVTILPNAFHPPQEAVCGIMVANANIPGLTGVQISTAVLLFSLLGISVGLAFWQQTGNKAKRDTVRLVQALGLVVLLALFAVWMKWWAAAIALSVLTILLLVISIRFAVD
jgi:hypothetical protein